MKEVKLNYLILKQEIQRGQSVWKEYMNFDSLEKAKRRLYSLEDNEDEYGTFMLVEVKEEVML